MSHAYLVDDGTMDTVLQCAICGRQERYNFDPAWTEEDGEDAYDRFVEDCLDNFEDDHICEGENQ